MALVEDTAAFMTDFAVPAEVGHVSLLGIFGNAHANALYMVVGSRPTLLIATADAPDVARNDAVTIGMDSYTVAEIQPDGTGMTRLVLDDAA